MKKKKELPNNLVAKHAREFNKSAVFVDQKKKSKKGYEKHKKSYNKDFYRLDDIEVTTI